MAGGVPIISSRNFERKTSMAMFDINGEEFFVGDTLKVIKGGLHFRAGTLLVCIYDDGSDCCRFGLLEGGSEGFALWVKNKRLQKV